MSRAKQPAVRAVLRHENRYLLAQHNNVIPENIGKWGTPGGRIESDDSDHETALRREMWEEFQVEIEIIGFVATYAYKESRHHVYLAIPAHTDFHVDGHEILDLAWLTAEEIAAWHEAGKLHTGFELDAIRRSQKLFPAG